MSLTIFIQLISIMYKIKCKLRKYKSVYIHHKNYKHYGILDTYTFKTEKEDITLIFYEDIETREKYIREVKYFNASFNKLFWYKGKQMENTTNISIPMIPLEPAINTAEIKAETLINLISYFYTLFKDKNVPDRFETFMSDCTKQAINRSSINELLIFKDLPTILPSTDENINSDDT